MASVEPPKLASFEEYNKLYDKYKNIRTEDYSYYQTRINDKSTQLYKKNNHEDRINDIKLQIDKVRFEVQPKKESNIFKRSIQSIIDCTKIFKSHRKFIFPSEKKLPELTPEILKVIANASIKEPSNETLTEIDGTPILRRDIQTLIGSNWLNDEIVNAYLSLIVKRSQSNNIRVYAFNTFFYPKLRDNGYNSVKRWTRKVDIFGHSFVLVPVHLGNHWCLAVINFIKRTITYYDSLGGNSHGCCDTLLDYLRNESLDKKKQDFGDENWTLIEAYSKQTIPVQKNFSDCGVFLCIYAEYLTRQAELNFKQEQMPYFREKMIYEIVTNKILDC